MTRLLHIVLLLWLSLLPLAGAAAERVALVIGMSNYQFANKLANTGNDAWGEPRDLEREQGVSLVE